MTRSVGFGIDSGNGFDFNIPLSFKMGPCGEGYGQCLQMSKVKKSEKLAKKRQFTN